MSTTSPFISAVEIDKRFGGVKALNAATVAFYPGEVHCLAGENGCGKSTLIKVLSGTHKPDAGRVVVDGASYDGLTPRQAIDLGVEVIYQDFSLLPNLTAAENIALPVLASRKRALLRKSEVQQIAEGAMARAGMQLELNTPVGDLTVADRQLCAVARALAHDAKFIAMDEPTTALTWREVDALFEAINLLRKDGVAIAFVSHKLQEVFTIADRVSIMRNGTVVATDNPSAYTHESLSESMTGRQEISLPRATPTWNDRAPAVRVQGLQGVPLFADIDFEIGQGEIVGLSGLLGSGRTEIAEALAGIRPASAGTIEVDGKPVNIKGVPDALAAGIAYVPEDRLTQGLFLDQPITDNIAVGALGRFTNGTGLLRQNRLLRACLDMVTLLRVKLGRPTDPVRTLSGGNAQRVLIARALMDEPKLLILNGPTVGVDVGSKFDILSILHAQALRGMGVLVISDDIPELVGTCNRVFVVRGGRITSEITSERLSEDVLLAEIAAA